jgi:hypothetical protein
MPGGPVEWASRPVKAMSSAGRPHKVQHGALNSKLAGKPGTISFSLRFGSAGAGSEYLQYVHKKDLIVCAREAPEFPGWRSTAASFRFFLEIAPLQCTPGFQSWVSSAP